MTVVLLIGLAELAILDVQRRFRRAVTGCAEGKTVGAVVASGLERLGGLWIKLGQMLSYRRDLLPEHVCDALGRLQAQVRPMGVVQTRKVLNDALRDLPANHDLTIEPSSFAAGCVAQVHRVRSREGSELVLKLRRRGVCEQIAIDLVIMRLFGRWLEQFRAFAGVPLAQVIEEIGSLLQRQTDLRLEGDNLVLMTPFLEDKAILVPRIVAASVGGDWLLMTEVVDLRGLDCQATPAPVRRSLARTGVLALYNMLFETGKVHADLHPGNVYVAEDALVFLDFGMVVDLRPEVRLAFRDFFLAFSSNNGDACARILLETALVVPSDLHGQEFHAAVAKIVERHAGLDAHAFQIVTFVRELFQVQLQFRVVGGTEFITAILSLLVFEGVVKRLDPRCDFQALARVTLPQILARQAPRRPWPESVGPLVYPDRIQPNSFVQQLL